MCYFTWKLELVSNILWLILAARFKKSLYFLQNEFSYILGNGAFIKDFLYFRKQPFLQNKAFFDISGNRHPEKIPNILGSEKQKNPLWKSFFYFRKWNCLSSSLNNFIYFRRNLQKLKNKNVLFFVCWERTFQI